MVCVLVFLYLTGACNNTFPTTHIESIGKLRLEEESAWHGVTRKISVPRAMGCGGVDWVHIPTLTAIFRSANDRSESREVVEPSSPALLLLVLVHHQGPFFETSPTPSTIPYKLLFLHSLGHLLSAVFHILHAQTSCLFFLLGSRYTIHRVFHITRLKLHTRLVSCHSTASSQSRNRRPSGPVHFLHPSQAPPTTQTTTTTQQPQLNPTS